ncbi:hypothetical protein JCM11491_001190 [Sporobolomyces phaffii]
MYYLATLTFPAVGPVKLDSPSTAVPSLSLARVHRLLRPLRSSVASFSQSLARTSTLPPPTTSSATPSVTTFYRASKSSIDKRDLLEWNNKKPKPKKRSSRGGQIQHEEDAVHSSSPFKDQHRRTRAKKGCKTYGTKRPTLLVDSSSYPSHASTSYCAPPTSLNPAPHRGIPKSTLRTTLESCFSRCSTSFSSNELSNLVNRTLHLFQTYDNILQIVYPLSRAGGGPSRSVPSLLETCAREIGSQIEATIDEWLEQVKEEEEARAGRAPEQEWTTHEMDRYLCRQSREPANACDDRDDSSDEGEEPASRRTSTSSYAASTRGAGKGMGDMTRNDQELECGRIQDEHYEACPSHTYRWILAEHATAIVSKELSKLFETEPGTAGNETLPYEFIEIWNDWCLSYGATSEASRFHALLVATAFLPPSATLSSTSCPPKHSPSFIALLLRSPTPTALVSSLESHLYQSTFSDRLLFHQYLSIPIALVQATDSTGSTKIGSYLDMSIRLATSMVKSYLQAYQSGTDGEEVRIDGVVKETRDIFDRVLKLLGCPAGDAALRGTIGRGSNSAKKRGKRVLGGRQGPLGILARLGRGDLTEGLRGLCEVAAAVEGLNDDRCSTMSDSSDDDKEEEDKLPAVSAQLGSIGIFLQLAKLVDNDTPSYGSCTSSTLRDMHDLPASTALISHYVSTHLLSSTSASSLLSAYDTLDRVTGGNNTAGHPSLPIRRAILMALRGGGPGHEDEALDSEVETRWARLHHETEAMKRSSRDSKASTREPNSRTFDRRRPTTHQVEVKSTTRFRSPRRSLSFDSSASPSGCASDSDIEIVSPPPARTTRLPPLPPPRQGGRSSCPAPSLFRIPSRHDTSYISSEPDELALLPFPRRLAPPAKAPPPKKRRITPPPVVVQAPLSPSPAPSSLEVSSEGRATSRSSSPPPPPAKSRRLSSIQPKKRAIVVPARKRKLDTFVRTHSAPSILFSTNTIGGDDDDDDELAMSF